MIDVIILAGGLGTRLQGVVSDVPKPMAKVQGEPFLSYILDNLSSKGFNRVIIGLGYKAEVITNFFKDSYQGMEIVYSFEEEPLGTGGGVLNALKYVKTSEFILMNGDTFFDVDFKQLIKFHQEKKGDISLALKDMDDASRYGTVKLDGKSRVSKFVEKSANSTGFINGGIYVINTNVLKVAEFPRKFSFEKVVLENNELNIKIFGGKFNNYFIDIGIPEDYSKAQVELKKRKALFLDRDGVINVEKNYIYKVEDVEFIEGIFALLKHYQDNGYLLFIVTNQAGIARGFYKEEDFHNITKWMNEVFASKGINITKVYFDPTHEIYGIGKYKRDSFDRKPNPGMIFKARDEYNLDLDNSILIGDKDSDIEAGINAGIKKNILVTPNSKNIYKEVMEKC